MRVLSLMRAPSVRNNTSLASCAAIDCTPFASGACKPRAQVQLRPQHLSFAASARSDKSCDTTLAPLARSFNLFPPRQAPVPNRTISAPRPHQQSAWFNLALLCSVLAWLVPQLALRWPSLSLPALPSWTSLGLCLGTLACIADSHAQRNKHPPQPHGLATHGARAAKQPPSMNPSPPVFWR